MLVPTPRKRKPRRNTSKRRTVKQSHLNYDRLEKKLPLTTFVVTTLDDVVDAED
jgi:hypothetical protein